jgi:hypothetical protein
VTCASTVVPEGPGKVGVRRVEYATGLHKDTVQRLTNDGKTILAEEAA